MIDTVNMGVNYAGVTFKCTNLVAHDLCSVLEIGKTSRQCRRIDVDISNITHILSYKYARIFTPVLVQDVALFLKNLASESGFIVTAVLDEDSIRP